MDIGMGWALFCGSLFLGGVLSLRLHVKNHQLHSDLCRAIAWSFKVEQELREVKAQLAKEDKERDEEDEQLALEGAGPFRADPEIDIEFFDDLGEIMGTSTAKMTVLINKFGLVVKGTSMFKTPRRAKVAKYTVWVGDTAMNGLIDPPRMMYVNDVYMQHFNIPITLKHDKPWRDRMTPPPPPVTGQDEKTGQTH